MIENSAVHFEIEPGQLDAIQKITCNHLSSANHSDTQSRTSPCTGKWDETDNIWFVETAQQDTLEPLLKCTIESIAEKMTHKCIR